MATDYLDTAHAAKEFGISGSYLCKLRHTGDGPEFIKLGRRVLYNRSKFIDWIESHSTMSTTSQ